MEKIHCSRYGFWIPFFSIKRPEIEIRWTCKKNNILLSLGCFKSRVSFLVLLLFALSAGAQNQYRNAGGMLTSWGERVNPANAWQEYPRPQMKRTAWKNLNGLWNYAITPIFGEKPERWQGKILVPFCAESSLSGVHKPVKPDELLWYKTTFSVPTAWEKKSVLLHFDAVDWEAKVWLNGKLVGKHKGGSDPFAFDVSPFIQSGKTQELVLSVWDPTDTDAQPRGKQVLDPKGIWYTPVTGIWQTVWIEPVEKTYISSLTPVADIDKQTITVYNKVEATDGKELLEIAVKHKGKIIAQKTAAANQPVTVSIPGAELWTPETPTLYQLEVYLKKGQDQLDNIASYFAMRKISTGKDAFGYERLLLNNKSLFQYGTLDQGWWPDGLLTPPSDAAMRYDIDVLKKMGFNMLRKHIKVEPSRYYYYADSIGMLIWQDMPSGFETAKADVQHVKWNAEKDWNRPAISSRQFETEWKNIMDHLRFFPSIVVWVPFNEGWGQYDTKRVVEWTMKYDPSRVVNGVSGWTDRRVGAMNDAHHYPGPGMNSANLHPGKVIVLGEFGGLGLPVSGHLWNPNMRNWGYRTYTTKEELVAEYSKLMNNLYPMINRGLASAIYTQTTDVEGEVNGLITYDRKKIKFNTSDLQKMHAPLYKEPVRSYSILPDAEGVAGKRLDSVLTTASNTTSAGMPVYTLEKAPLILQKETNASIRKKFTVTNVPEHIQLRISGHADVKVYLNDQLVVDKFIQTRRHYDEINLNAFAKYLRPGENQIRVQVQNVRSDIPYDIGLYGY